MLSSDSNRPPLYSPTLRKWLHQYRDPTHDHQLRPLSAPAPLLPPSYRPTRSERPGIKHGKHEWWYRCLSQDAPETGAAVGHIDSLLEESQVVSAHGELLDPTVGALLALGGGARDEQRAARAWDTAVFAMGPAGADVGMAALVEEWWPLAGAAGVGVGVWGVGGAVRVAEMESRVRQVCVAGGAGGGGGEVKSTMAVRTANSTAVFRQRRTEVPLPGRASRLAAVPLASVPGGTGRAAHAHVAFNPWYEKQLGIIDEGGRWRVYDLEGAQARDWRVRSEVTAAETGRGAVGSEGGGGWGRLVWGADVNSVVACDRKRAGLFDIRNIPATRADLPIPIYQGVDQGWLLDLQRAPSPAPSHDTFLLTAATLTWHDLRFASRPVMSLPHHRHQNDISLAMALLPLAPATLNVLLYSRLNSLVTSLRFDRNEAENFPVTLGLPAHVPGLAPRDVEAPVQLGLTVLQSPLRVRGTPDASGEAYLADERLRFFTAFGVGPELAITRRVYSNQADPDPAAAIALGPERPRAVKSAYTVPADDDEDDDDDASLPDQAAAPAPSAPAAADETRVGFHALYKHAFPLSDPTLRTAAATDPEHSVGASTARLKAALARRLARADLGIITLLNLHRPAMLYDRLDALQAAVHALLTADADLAPYHVRSLLPAPRTPDSDGFLAIAPAAPPLLAVEDLYNALLAAWVVPLPESTPGRVRLHRERIARALATDLFLATVGVNLQPQAQPAPEPETAQQEEHILGIRTYANVAVRVALAEPMAAVLGRWEVGADPEDVEYVPDDEGAAAAAERRRRRQKQKQKARRGGVDEVGRLRGEVESWSLGTGSQPPAVVVASQVLASQGGGSSQVAPGPGPAAVMSQVERGRHGGRAPVGRKKRRTGF